MNKRKIVFTTEIEFDSAELDRLMHPSVPAIELQNFLVKAGRVTISGDISSMHPVSLSAILTSCVLETLDEVHVKVQPHKQNCTCYVTMAESIVKGKLLRILRKRSGDRPKDVVTPPIVNVKGQA